MHHATLAAKMHEAKLELERQATAQVKAQLEEKKQGVWRVGPYENEDHAEEVRRAAGADDVATLAAKLNGGCGRDAQDGGGNTALIMTCKQMDAKAVRALVAAAAQLDVQNREGYTALMTVCNCEGNDDAGTTIVRIILAAGANVELKA